MVEGRPSNKEVFSPVSFCTDFNHREQVNETDSHYFERLGNTGRSAWIMKSAPPDAEQLDLVNRTEKRMILWLSV